MNLYQGMNMNPVNFVDPWGLVSGEFCNQLEKEITGGMNGDK